VRKRERERERDRKKQAGIMLHHPQRIVFLFIGKKKR